MTSRPEAKLFYGCPERRCPVLWWPVEVGDRCPSCNGPGVYLGARVKAPDVPVEEEPS